VYFIPYLYMFAAYVVLRRQAFGGVLDGSLATDNNPGARARSDVPREIPRSKTLATLVGACGFLTTLLAMGMSVVPPPDGAMLYELKVLGGVAAFVLAGAIIYWRNH